MVGLTHAIKNRKPGKWQKGFPFMENSWKMEKRQKLITHGKFYNTQFLFCKPIFIEFRSSHFSMQRGSFFYLQINVTYFYLIWKFMACKDIELLMVVGAIVLISSWKKSLMEKDNSVLENSWKMET